MRTLAGAFVAILLPTLMGCGSSPAPQKQSTTQPRPARDPEAVADLVDVLSLQRGEVRQIGSDAALKANPGWTVKGASSSRIDGGGFIVAVDMTRGSEERIVNMFVRRFIATEGKSYLKAEVLKPELLGILTKSTKEKD